MAAAQNFKGVAWVPRAHRILPEIHCKLCNIVAPLTVLLKKEAFQWSEASTEAFLALKHALMTAPLLQIPDFSKRFVVDCDALGSGFGAVLYQGEEQWHISVELWHHITRNFRHMREN